MRIHPSLIVCLALAACSSRREASPVTLTSSALYNIDSVRAAMTLAHPGAWDKKLVQAVALYRNKQHFYEAADSLKSVIYHAPSARAYFELGTALLMAQAYDESVHALRIAEQLQYAPLHNVLYELSAAYANRPYSSDSEQDKDQTQAIYYMRVALQMGFPKPEAFTRDPAFARICVNYQFKDAYNEAMGGRKDLVATMWHDFMTGFGPLALPLTIDTQWTKLHPPTRSDDIAFNFEKYITEMRTAHFARGSEPGYFYVGKVREDSAYVAVIYGGSDDWGEYTSYDPSDTTRSLAYASPIFFYLTTYSTQGKIIDKMMIGGQDSYDKPYKFFSMDVARNFVVTDLQFSYIFDTGDHGFNGNPVARDSVLAVQHYRINPDGKFEKVDAAPLAMR